MLARLATCVCGRLTASCSGDPAQVSLCHCLACQRRTGSTYGIAAFYPRENVRVAGDATAYTRPSDSGYTVTFYFCPHCGSTVYWEPRRKPEMRRVARVARLVTSLQDAHKAIFLRGSASETAPEISQCDALAGD